MRLSDLIEGLPARHRHGMPDIDITGLAADSRQVRQGHLFAAFRGSRNDGRRFIDDALDHGAVAVLVGDDAGVPALEGRAAIVAAASPRHVFARMCARFHAPPPGVVVAVTGTNGKSSVVDFCRQFWSVLGVRAASFGTLGMVTPEGIQGLEHTTPDPAGLHACLGRLHARNIDRVALEASSHGLHQRRLDGLRVDAAAFTSFSRDHLDYHVTAESYLEAKLHLFDLMRDGGTAVLNADMAEYKTVAEWLGNRTIVSFGETPGDITLESLADTGDGHQVLEVRAADVTRTIKLPLAGHFQAMNVLCAAALIAAVEDQPVHDILALAGHLECVPGRLEMVPGHPAGARVYVDYAHTPDALATVLTGLRGTTEGRLAVVFGCGGDRDREKRPQMGAIAARLADDVCVTDDNPRTENAALIRRAILAAAPGARESGDRREAIQNAVASLGGNDVLVVAGKGHERGQVVNGDVLPFDDREEVRRAFRRGGS